MNFYILLFLELERTTFYCHQLFLWLQLNCSISFFFILWRWIIYFYLYYALKQLCAIRRVVSDHTIHGQLPNFFLLIFATFDLDLRSLQFFLTWLKPKIEHVVQINFLYSPNSLVLNCVLVIVFTGDPFGFLGRKASCVLKTNLDISVLTKLKLDCGLHVRSNNFRRCNMFALSFPFLSDGKGQLYGYVTPILANGNEGGAVVCVLKVAIGKIESRLMCLLFQWDGRLCPRWRSSHCALGLFRSQL